MTLATIFLLGTLLTPSANPLPGARLQPSTLPFASGHAQDAQSQPATTPTQRDDKQNPGAAAKPQAGQQTTGPKPHRRKKKTNADCGTLPASNSAAANSSSAKNSPAATTGAQTAAAAKPTKNCPPEKIVVVRHGGSTDPSIQLAGGAIGGQATQEKATANQMLESTEENLKKLEGRQLNPSERATVTQIRQYMEQSKTAITSNDLERARTLAWKAQTLSDDLANPKQ